MCTRFCRYAWPEAEHLASEYYVCLSQQSDRHIKKAVLGYDKDFYCSKQVNIRSSSTSLKSEVRGQLDEGMEWSCMHRAATYGLIEVVQVDVHSYIW